MSSYQSNQHFSTRFFMRISTFEGGFSQVHQILTAGLFLTGLALALGAKPWQLGFLAAVPHMTQIFQLIGAYFVEATGRRKIVAVYCALASRIVWLGVPLLFYYATPGTAMAWLLGLVILASSLELMAGNAWTTWMADLIPRQLRGRYFGFRSAVMAGITICATIGGGYWLQLGGERFGIAQAFTAVLIIACLAGIIGAALLIRQPDIPRPVDRVAPKISALLLQPVQNRKSRRALQFFLAWHIAIGFSAAFFNVHMFTELAMSYVAVGIFHSIKPAVAMLLFRGWGKIIDQFQIKAVLLVSGLIITCLPFIWLLPVAGHTHWLWVIALLSGLAWTGFNLSAYTYPMQHSPQIGRSYFIAYFSIVSGLGFVLASITGGWVAQQLTDWVFVVGDKTYMSHHLLFVCSGIMRLLAIGLLLRLDDVEAPGALALITRIGAGMWRTASMGRPFPRWIRRTLSEHK